MEGIRDIESRRRHTSLELFEPAAPIWTSIPLGAQLQPPPPFSFGLGMASRPLRRTTVLQIPLCLLLLLLALITPSHAVRIPYTNCLDSSVNSTTPKELQWIPLIFEASFDTQNPSHNINITVYGNVTGTPFNVTLPPSNSPEWEDPQYNYGKINNVFPGGNLSTFIPRFKVLTYEPVTPPASAFCDTLRDGTQCPIIPAFNGSFGNPSSLPAFGFSEDLNASFRFATLDTTFIVNSGQLDDEGNPIAAACVSANITPSLGTSIRGILRYLPVAVLAVVALATVSAAIFSPWGSSDPFKWTSNYGRDEDLIRLVTPGFGDCLQYIQFICLSGAISISYPGYFRPVVSSVNWSALMFNESLASSGTGLQNPQDGLYVTSGGYGFSQMRELAGMSADEDVWAGMAVWLLSIIAAVVIVCQLVFFARFLLRLLADRPEEDLRSKNWPLTGGMLVRIVCNYFLLPIVSITLFQLVVAPNSLAVVTAMAVVLLVAILAFALWILRIIFLAKPRSLLFDDLPTVLLYGPLYNTYSDDAALFALIPALLTLIRGIAIGAVQPSGIAQLVVLAICEVIFILTLHAFRPFRSQTSMNAYHTFFSVTRLVAVLLSVAFVPNLGVTEPSKGWIGYIILFLHAVVLVFGFLLNSIQTLIEVVARMAGAGSDANTGAATRGTIVKAFGMRQLSRRQRRPGFRHSMTSDAAMLTEDGDAENGKAGSRSRSLSASSAILLNSRTPDRLSAHLDRVDSSLPDAERTTEFSFLPEAGPSRRPDLSLRTGEPSDPYYRPPRQRRPTAELMTPGARSRGSWASGDWIKKGYEDTASESPDKRDSGGRPLSMSPESKAAPAPAYMRQREGSDPMLNSTRRSDVDYAVREVDYYYGVRGPALSNLPTRKLKTGPADPVGPVSSATGWFRSMFGGKTKESGKGFEVVRSSRAPPQRLEAFEEEEGITPYAEPYHDNPPTAADATVLPGQKTRSSTGDEAQPDRRDVVDGSSFAPSPINSDDDESEAAQRTRGESVRISDIAPSLGPIDAGESLHLPSRFGSQASHMHRNPSAVSRAIGEAQPALPPKNSRRASKGDEVVLGGPHSSALLDEPRSGRRLSFEDGVSSQARVPLSPLSLVSASQRSGAAPAEPPADTTASLMAPSGGNMDRPTSTGIVQSFRASESITQTSPDLNVHEGSAAEFVSTSRNSRASREQQWPL